METIYRAFDGKEFEDWRLCKQYEFKEKLTTKSYPILADKNGDIISAEDVIENPKRSMDIYYIFYKNRDEYENGNELLEEFGGFSIPEQSVPESSFSKPCGVWWDDNKSSWVDVEELLAELEAELEIKKNRYEKVSSLCEGV